MAKVKVDIRELKALAERIKNLSENQVDSFLMDAARALADEFHQRVKRRTPVGEYPDTLSFTVPAGTAVNFTTKDGKAVNFTTKRDRTREFPNPVAGKSGGHLRNSWKIRGIEKISGGYEVEILNDASTEKGENYASHVEYGHRIMNKKGGPVKGWQPGKFMMKITENEIRDAVPGILEKRFERFLRQVVDGG